MIEAVLPGNWIKKHGAGMSSLVARGKKDGATASVSPGAF